MALTINTNMSSLIAQRSLNKATSGLDKSIERLTTGYTINHAADNAAGYSIMNQWTTKLSSIDVASSNAATGADLLTTAEDTYSILTDHLSRIRDLTEQAANGTYGSTSLKAIQAEIYARLQEIDRISANTEFNGIKLMSYSTLGDEYNTDVGIRSTGIDLQVGIQADENSVINLSTSLFQDSSICGLFKVSVNDPTTGTGTLTDILSKAGCTIGDLGKKGTAADEAKKIAAEKGFAAACSNLVYDSTTDTYSLQMDSSYSASKMLPYFDKAISEISSRVTNIGANQSRITSAEDALTVQSENITSSLSTLRDTDVAKESSNYVQQQILQQASATLLATANQLPSIALNLI